MDGLLFQMLFDEVRIILARPGCYSKYFTDEVRHILAWPGCYSKCFLMK